MKIKLVVSNKKDKKDWEVSFENWIRTHKLCNDSRYRAITNRIDNQKEASNILLYRRENYAKDFINAYMKDQKIKKEFKTYLAIQKMLGSGGLNENR